MPAATLLLAFLPAPALPQDQEAPATRLPADARAGTVREARGTALVRAVGEARWSAARQGQPLEPGSWLRTGRRGACALEVDLPGGGRFLLGPGAQAELVDPVTLRLEGGECELRPPAAGTIRLLAGGGERAVRERQVVRASFGSLAVLGSDPKWLRGYRSDTPAEALGALLANVDGRRVPLTIGWHKVTVDIRDQVARTVVEESFVNHSGKVLEGVFYFPLPDDASVSGFAMWIGGRRVEGEIVEKQRARRIYEQLLQEKKDPGLLEWQGGNLFQARVYPIHGEKRIRIAYTQFLRRDGDTWRYRYALRSEMLRRNPLERLEIGVTISSADPLAEVVSPSHACRIRRTENAASIEYADTEVVPEKDFEVAVRLAPGRPSLRFLPYRRGDEGFFLMSFEAPPLPEDALPGGPAPVHLVVVADTSGSMAGPARTAQLGFVEALLAALGPDDRFQLLTADAEVQAAFPRVTPAEPGAVEAALALLESRETIGWTDAQAALDAAIAYGGPGAQIVYVGDGVATAGGHGGPDVARAVSALDPNGATCHAVVPGSLSDPVMLQAIAGLGGGTVRRLDPERPARAAAELLDEIARPGWEDLEIRLPGLPVAAVHPGHLARLPGGRQAVVLGRYDPAVAGEEIEVGLRARAGERWQEWRAQVRMADAAAGNSFLSRLWARRHLDALLAEGDSPAIRERVLALSEGFQIMTPWSSFLVLEDEEDRARFAMERRLHPRDGEEFFAAGRAEASYALRQQQLRAARLWRLRWRARVMETLAGLARDRTEALRSLLPPVPGEEKVAIALGVEFQERFRHAGKTALGFGEGGRTYKGPGDTVPPGSEWRGLEALGYAGGEEELDVVEEESRYGGAMVPMAAPAPRPPAAGRPMAPGELAQEEDFRYAGDSRARRSLDKAPAGQAFDDGEAGWRAGKAPGAPRPPAPPEPLPGFFPAPGLPRRPPEPGLQEPEVVSLLASLDRRPVLAGGSWDLRFHSEALDPRGNSRWRSEGRLLVAGSDWAAIPLHLDSAGAALQWYRDGRRGCLDATWGGGRDRPGRDGDALAWPSLWPWAFGDAVASLRFHRVEERRVEDGRVVLRLRRGDSMEILELHIDPERKLVMEVARYAGPDLVERIRVEQVQEIGGLAWPAVLSGVDGDGLPYSRAGFTVRALEPGEAAGALDALLAPVARALVLHEDRIPRSLAECRQRVAAGAATPECWWRLLGDAVDKGREAEARRALEAMLAGQQDWLGAAAARIELLDQLHEGEERLDRLREIAAAIASAPPLGRLARARWVLDRLVWLGADELEEILRLLRPVFQAAEMEGEAGLEWDRAWLGLLEDAEREEGILAWRRTMAEQHPGDAGVQVEYARFLAAREGTAAGIAWLERAEESGAPWRRLPLLQLRAARLDLHWQACDPQAMVELVGRWLAEPRVAVGAGLLDRALSARLVQDRVPEWQRLRREFAHVPEPGQEGLLARARLAAGLRHLLGRGYAIGGADLAEGEARRLAAVARECALRPGLRGYARSVAENSTFRASPAGRDLLAGWARRLEVGAGDLPVDEVIFLLRTLRALGVRGGEEDEAWWEARFRTCMIRQAETSDPLDRVLLAALIRDSAPRPVLLDFLRRELAAADGPEEVEDAARSLFAALLEEDWSVPVEEELLALLPRLGHAPAPVGGDPEGPAAVRILALYDLVDWMVDRGAAARLASRGDAGAWGPRRRREEEAAARRLAQQSALERLRALAGGGAEAIPASWLAVERMALQLSLEDGVEGVAAESLRLLEGLVEAHRGAADPELLPLADRILALRLATTAAWLAAGAVAAGGERNGAEPVLQALRRGRREAPALLDWVGLERDLLLAVEDLPALEAFLRERMAAEPLDPGPGVALGRLLAETDRLEDAVALWLGLDRRDLLGHGSLRSLRDWLIALDRREESESIGRRSWEVLSESDLNRRLRQDLAAVQPRGDGPPGELDPEAPLRLQVLWQRASRPERYFWVARRLYETTRDFRLLQGLPFAVLGHTRQGVYGFLEGLDGLLEVVQEEATLDRLRATLDARLEEGEWSVTDRRALLLLTLRVELRAARLAEGGMHAGRAMAALEEVWSVAAWTPDEARLLAGLLGSGPRWPGEALQQARLRRLAELHGKVPRAGDASREIAEIRVRVLEQAGEKEAALRVAETELASWRAERGGELPDSCKDLEDAQVRLLRESGRTLEGEEILLGRLARARTQELRDASERELFEYRRQLLEGGGQSRLGSGDRLYGAVLASLLEGLQDRESEARVPRQVDACCEWFETAWRARVRGVLGDLLRFSREELPRVLARHQYRSGQRMVSRVAAALRDLRAPRHAVSFLLERARNEAAWLRYAGQDFWAEQSRDLERAVLDAKWRLDGDSERELLAVILREMRRDLESGRSRSRRFYDKDRRSFWRQQAGVFARTAREAALRAGDDEARLRHIASYLDLDLGLPAEAAGILAGLERRGLLSPDGRDQLAGHLVRAGRFGEAEPLLAALVELRPGELDYRLRLLSVRHRAAFPEADLEQVRAAAEAWLREHDAWQAGPIAKLAATSLRAGLSEAAARLFHEAIAQRTGGQGPSGADPTLAGWYEDLAAAQAALGRTGAAVEAAAGAVLAWGGNEDRREAAWKRLVAVLRTAEDLDRWVRGFESEVEESGLENPLLRKALGEALLDRDRPRDAARHLREAVAVRPADEQARARLVEALERAGEPEDALAERLAWARTAGHDLDLWRDCARAAARTEGPEAARRWWSQLIEVDQGEHPEVTLEAMAHLGAR